MHVSLTCLDTCDVDHSPSKVRWIVCQVDMCYPRDVNLIDVVLARVHMMEAAAERKLVPGHKIVAVDMVVVDTVAVDTAVVDVRLPGPVDVVGYARILVIQRIHHGADFRASIIIANHHDGRLTCVVIVCTVRTVGCECSVE